MHVFLLENISEGNRVMFQSFSTIIPMGKRPKVQKKPPKLYLAEWIDALRRERKDIAKAAGVQVNYIANIKAGRKENPSSHVLYLMSIELGCTVNDFYLP